MPAPPPTRRFTVDEYHRMAEAGVLHEDDRVELFDGQIVVMTPVGSRHAAAVGRLTYLFSERAGNRAIVWVQNPIVVSQHREPQPDVCLLRPRDDFYARTLPRAEDVFLVVEVGDTSAQDDRARKLPQYADASILEAWLVDLNDDLIEVHREPGPGRYRDVRVLRRGETLAALAFPAAAISVDEVLGPEG